MHRNTKIRPNRAESALTRNLPWWWLAIAMAVFTIFAYWILPVMNGGYLWRISEQSLFVPTSGYFWNCMKLPGGLLSWVALFFSQFYFYPWLGATFFITMLLGLWVMVYKAFRLPGAMFPLASLPSSCVLLSVVVLGDLIFTLKLPGFAFAGVLGFASAVGVWWVYRSVSSVFWCMAVLCVAAIAGYPCLGFYALLGVGLCVVSEIAKRRSWWLVALGMALMAFIPVAYFRFVPENRLMAENIYTSGLPRLFSHETSLLIPYAVVALLFATGVVAYYRMGARPGGTRRMFMASGVVMLLGIGTVRALQYKDGNFKVAMDMGRAISAGNWRGAVESARSQQGRPSRVVGMMTHLALNRLGWAGDSLFTFCFADEPHESTRPEFVMRQFISRDILMRLGRVNDAYRWCMEDMVEYGPKAEYLKTMAICALLNGEYALARKYLRPLQKTLFYSDMASRYMEYADNPGLIEQDGELSRIRHLSAYDNMLAGDGSLLETYVTRLTAQLAGGPPELVELSLQYNLILKDISEFWPRFMLYARHHQRLPVHYQEAAILYSALEGSIDWRQFNIERRVEQRFSRFMQMAQRHSGLSDEANLEIFKPEFGDTFWYYYFFVKGLKTS